MVQSYLRHGQTQAFGVVCSSSSNSLYDGRLAYVPALEDVLVWDIKKGQVVSMWHETGQKAEVTYIAKSPQRETYAVGYADGSIRLWSNGSVTTTFNGHKKAVTVIVFDAIGARMASGSQDTDIILWDIVSESGLFRLRGHRDQITALRFLSSNTEVASTSTSAHPNPGFLLSASKDTFLKVWHLSTHHCIQTVIAHRSEVWAMDIDAVQSLLFTGSNEGELKAWSLDLETVKNGVREPESGVFPKVIRPVATLPLLSRHRVAQIAFHPTGAYLAVQSHDRSIELFRIRTVEEVGRKQARRKKRTKEKQSKLKGNHNKMTYMDKEGDGGMSVDELGSIGLTDLFSPYLIVRANGKIRSFDFVKEESSHKNGTQIFVALGSNALEVYNIPSPTKAKSAVMEASRLYSLDIPGHRTDIRALCLSSDDTLLASASNGSLKLWNVQTTASIRTLDCGYAMCVTFLPGGRHLAVGTKSGHLLLYDLSSSSLIETIPAHTGTVWSLHVRADGQTLVTGSADKDIKFWEIEHGPSKDEGSTSNGLSLIHARTLKMTDDVLSVRFSPNGRLLAVSLLDSTVKVFYQDTLKFFLSLYGHKLPVLAMDISHDSKLIVTCSADKNVKIWGLDFGDCHKSIFAHDESVMQVAFEKRSHYFWTVGKDKLLKYWDGDKFELIQRLEGHHSEIWALAVSNDGNFVVTGSHDKSIRIWEKLDEPLFLEEEREREMEAMYESGLTESLNATDPAIGSAAPDTDTGNVEESAEVTTVSKQTSATLTAGEHIIEALDLADTERQGHQEYLDATASVRTQDEALIPPPAQNPVLVALGIGADEYVLKEVEKVAAAALFDALLALPFQKVLSLMVYLSEWAKQGWNITLVSRVTFFLMQTHHRQIVANRVMRTALIPLRTHLRSALRTQKETIGYNLAALRYIKTQDEAIRMAQFYEEADTEDSIPDEDAVRARIKEGSKKRKRMKL